MITPSGDISLRKNWSQLLNSLISISLPSIALSRLVEGRLINEAESPRNFYTIIRICVIFPIAYIAARNLTAFSPAIRPEL